MCYDNKRRMTKEEKMKRNIKVILLTSLVTLSMFVVSGCDLFIKTNKGSVDFKWYMGITYED